MPLDNFCCVCNSRCVVVLPISQLKRCGHHHPHVLVTWRTITRATPATTHQSLVSNLTIKPLELPDSQGGLFTALCYQLSVCYVISCSALLWLCIEYNVGNMSLKSGVVNSLNVRNRSLKEKGCEAPPLKKHYKCKNSA